MTDHTDPNTRQAPEKTLSGPHNRPEGGCVAPVVREGENGPQAGADGLRLRKLIAGAIHDTPARYPDDIADAVWRVIQPHLNPELQRQLQAAISALGKSEADLARVRALARYTRDRTEAGESDWAIGQHELALAVLDTLDEQPEPEKPTHNAGPSVREARP
ncbi:hypothetical protein [Streptomyces griseoloalbus]|uniref:Uncharacterized protein n=1 Tax=Streptomyces griseoloalbus TaxID=67303 RepID=A0A7W8BUQ4_9ACTN|nr:hypothetical protein [Streptomyces albaduncus]MBB5129780.1 hypothetical protein [Streptomyces albaduncus]GGW82013.1 hypothetical protein GCM10010340_70010 [Streptomyces albaduncus]